MAVIYKISGNVSQNRPRMNKLFGAFSLMFICFVLGAAAAILPYWFLIASLFLPVFVIGAWLWPELGLVCVLALLYGVVPQAFVPSLPLAGGQIKASELAFVSLLAIVALKYINRGGEIINAMRPYLLPFGLLFVLAFISILNGFFVFHNHTKYILYESRTFLYWLVIPAVALIVDSRRKLDLLVLGILFVGILLALMVLVQSFTGVTLLSAGRGVEDLQTSATLYRDVVRSNVGGGIFVIMFSLFLLVARGLYKAESMIKVVVWILILSAAVIATFGRGIWFAGLFSALVMSLMIGTREFVKLLVLGSLIIVIAATGLAVSRPNMLDAIEERITSVISHSMEKDEAVEWRAVEREYAYKKIVQYPILGIGLGGEYQPLRNHFMSPEQTRFIHNGYLYLVLKMGVFALLVPFWVFGALASNARRILGGGVNVRYKALTVSILAAFLIPMITALTQPEWMDYPGVALMGLMIGLMISITKLHQKGEI
jgi:hypothetical protein